MSDISIRVVHIYVPLNENDQHNIFSGGKKYEDLQRVELPFFWGIFHLLYELVQLMHAPPAYTG